MKVRIIKNAAKCNYCGDVIESTYRHDFQTCSCGRVSVDGGHDYLRRQGKREYWEELSEIVFDEPVKDNEEGDKQSATPLCR